MSKPVVLCIMDGVGIGQEENHNAVEMAKMSCYRGLLRDYPHSQLNASGPAVGLPDGTMGNSEVGHITIGSGRVVNQFLRRFQLENWKQNAPLRDFIDSVRDDGGIVHVAGLMSDGRVHSDARDILTIVRFILDAGVRVCIHFIADGRDTPPQSAPRYVAMIQESLAPYLADGRAFFGTLSGRYYAMDRNKNMDRTESAFNAIACAKSEYVADDIDSALADAYARGETDEFIRPTVISGDVPITSKDGFLFGNYRSDRARQIVRAVLGTGARMLCFSQYGEGLNELCPALLPDESVGDVLGDVLAQHGKTQLRIEITDALLPKLSQFDVVILNYANGDMVGHTGNQDATIRAMEFLDKQLARLVPAVLELGGVMLITADHGNAEKMWDDVNNLPWTAHTTNPVNFIVVSNEKHVVHDGGLADIAPTILKLVGIEQPKSMTGKSLID